MKRITLCADDYGIHPGVSEAIIKLAQLQRIHATNALVTAPHWLGCAPALKQARGLLDIGLHLNFTEGNGLTRPFYRGLPGLLPMIWKSHCRVLPHRLIESEIRAQLELFMDTMEMRPQFIDGHQHIHHLPQVRDALLKVLQEYQLDKLWIRSVYPMINNAASLKSCIISDSGARKLRSLIDASPLYTNASFAGVYSLSEKEPFDQLMQYWLDQLPDCGLIMCHPGTHQADQSNPDHAPARQREFNYLASNDFLEVVTKADITLGRLPNTSLPTNP